MFLGFGILRPNHTTKSVGCQEMALRRMLCPEWQEEREECWWCWRPEHWWPTHCFSVEDIQKLLGARASLLVTKGIATRSKDATNGASVFLSWRRFITVSPWKLRQIPLVKMFRIPESFFISFSTGKFWSVRCPDLYLKEERRNARMSKEKTYEKTKNYCFVKMRRY